MLRNAQRVSFKPEQLHHARGVQPTSCLPTAAAPTTATPYKLPKAQTLVMKVAGKEVSNGYLLSPWYDGSLSAASVGPETLLRFHTEAWEMLSQITLETGEIGRQANAAVMATMGETVSGS